MSRLINFMCRILSWLLPNSCTVKSYNLWNFESVIAILMHTKISIDTFHLVSVHAPLLITCIHYIFIFLIETHRANLYTVLKSFQVGSDTKLLTLHAYVKALEPLQPSRCNVRSWFRCFNLKFIYTYLWISWSWHRWSSKIDCFVVATNPMSRLHISSVLKKICHIFVAASWFFFIFT